MRAGKVRVVDWECASDPGAQSSSYEPGDPRTADKYPRGDHPSPKGSCDLGLSGANKLMRSTHGHLRLTCQARRSPFGGRRVTFNGLCARASRLTSAFLDPSQAEKRCLLASLVQAEGARFPTLAHSRRLRAPCRRR
jgi:hypothetical protein